MWVFVVWGCLASVLPSSWEGFPSLHSDAVVARPGKETHDRAPGFREGDGRTDGVGRGQRSTWRQVTVGAVTSAGPGGREGTARAGSVGDALQGMSLQRSTASVRTTAQQGASWGDITPALFSSHLLIFRWCSWGQIQLEAREQDSWGGAL